MKRICDVLSWTRASAAPAAEASGGGAPRALIKDVASASANMMDFHRRRPVLDTRERGACGRSEWGWGPASLKDVASASANMMDFRRRRPVLDTRERGGASASGSGGGAPRR